jgi:hypothetical protein
MEKIYDIVDMHHVKFNRKKHVRIDRKSKWGNPYILENPDNEEERLEVLRKYTLYLLRNQKLLDDIPSLEGKTLSCWCYPSKKCHGQILQYLTKNPELIERCGKACVDRETIAIQIFEGLGWEYKKKIVQTTLF